MSYAVDDLHFVLSFVMRDKIYDQQTTMLNHRSSFTPSHNEQFHHSKQQDISQSTIDFLEEKTNNAVPIYPPSRFKLFLAWMIVQVYKMSYKMWILYMFIIGVCVGVWTNGSLYSGSGRLFVRSKDLKNGIVYLVPPVHFERDMLRHTNREVSQHLYLTLLRNELKNHCGNEDVFINTVKHPVRAIPEEESIRLSPDSFFKEFVTKSKPVILKGFAKNFPAFQRWRTDEYFKSVIGKQRVKVEVVKRNGQSSETQYRRMEMNDYLSRYLSPNRKTNYYLAETSMEFFTALSSDYPDSPFIFSRYLFTRESVQLWLSAGGTTTPTHNDEFENLLCQIVGRRVVLLYHHFQNDLLYTSNENTYIDVDPEHPDLTKHPRYKYSKPVKADVQEGDCLFIPAYWYHLAKASTGRNVAVNYWYQPPSKLEELVYLTVNSKSWRDPEDSTDKLLLHRKRNSDTLHNTNPQQQQTQSTTDEEQEELEGDIDN
jgi:hypothetical protein